MAIFKCKMCGGSLEVEEGASYGICEYCGTKQTLPTSKDETLQNLFNRANTLRKKAEFDKASELYEKILQVSDSEAEAYWGLILCKYGVEYVEDPATFKRVPTCHRASYDAVTADEDYKNALKYADPFQKTIYEEEAAAIEKIQQGIISVAQKEDPYDVFICYKETDENGRRTPDSALANDVYYHLKREGFKAFYAAITLEDKLGTEYEPYIFSALNTAKVMLVIGTKPEYFNAVWVKNEWSRFLKIIKKDRTKLLIPCYRDMDPYELPEEFAHLQAQDMSKIGFINDIVRGIKKIIVKETPQPQGTTVKQGGSGSAADAQVKRGNMALEDREWDKADSFFEKALNLDPENAEAYLGKLMADKHAQNWSDLIDQWKNKYLAVSEQRRLESCPEEKGHIEKMVEEYALNGFLNAAEIRRLYTYDRGYGSSLLCRKNQKEQQLHEISNERLLNRAKQFAKGSTKEQIENGLAVILKELDDRIVNARKEEEENAARKKAEYAEHIAITDKTVMELSAKAHALCEKKYQEALKAKEEAVDIPGFSKAISALKELKGNKDSNELIIECQKEISRLNEEKRLEEEKQAQLRREEEERQEELRRKEEERLDEVRKKEAAEKAKKTRKIMIILAAVLVVFAVAIVALKNGKRKATYNEAVSLMEKGEYGRAVDLFKTIEGYKDSNDCLEKIYINVFGEDYYRTVKSISPGDNYVLGSYEQNNKTEDGPEDIEWIVLDKKGDDILLVSVYSLDIQRFNETEVSVKWESCTLRKWLNETFLEKAFNTDEKKVINITKTEQDSEDMIFLLNESEAKKYFPSDSERQSSLTSYTRARAKEESTLGGGWWLRSPNYGVDSAIVAKPGGTVAGGLSVNHPAGIRPALWVNLFKISEE